MGIPNYRLTSREVSESEGEASLARIGKVSDGLASSEATFGISYGIETFLDGCSNAGDDGGAESSGALESITSITTEPWDVEALVHHHGGIGDGSCNCGGRESREEEGKRVVEANCMVDLD